jgi:DNA repair exonuclease SbcCD ATPase subunit
VKLVLENFRSHEKASFELPDVGFVKIDGPSGTGKSNVFKALRYCLYGKQNNAVRYGANGCRVEAELDQLKVTRGKGPTLFEANGIPGEAGQGIIQTALGMNELEFEVSSYIAQDQANSFIHCKPAEQMDLLQRLAFNQDNPESFKERAKTLLEEAEKTSKTIKQEIAITENTLSLKTEQLQTATANAIEPDTPEVNDTQDTAKVEGLKKQCIDIKGKIISLEKNLNDPVRERITKAEAYLESLLPKQNEHQKWFTENPEITFSQQNEMDAAQITVTHLEAQVKEYEDMQKRISDKNGCERKVNTYGDQLQDLISELQPDTVLDSATAIHEISGKYIKAKKDLDAANGVFDYLDDPTLTLTEARAKLQEIKKLHEEWIGIQAIRDQKKKDALDVNIGIDKARTFIANNNVEPVDSINEKIRQLRSQLETTEAEYNALNTAISNATAITKLWDEYRRKLATIESLKKEITGITATLQKQQTQAETIGTRCAKLKRFLELVQKAALSALDARISEINIRAEHWLEVLFNGNLQATIETEKEAKNGNVSHKINLAIYENGTKIEKKEELSGGQQSRLALAFQLALSDMYKSPVLMLDESLKGCDVETSKICLEAIRQISERKLVLMVEHHVEDSQFDKVVPI